MVIPKYEIPTFDELLKKIKQPKVTVGGLVGDELDSDGALELGYKIPANWKLRQDITGASLISPRGNIFKNLKLGPEGNIEDFGVFSAGGTPIKLPPSLLKPPPEPPPTEPPELPLEVRLRTEEGISIGEYEKLGITTEEQRRALLRPAEELIFPISPEGLETVRIVGGIKEPETFMEQWERVGETAIAAARAPLFEVAGVPISAGDVTALALIAFGIYQVGNTGWNMLLDKVLRRPGDLNLLGRQLTRAGLNRNLNIIERQYKVKIPAATRNAFIQRYLNDMAAAWERNIASQGANVNIQSLQLASQNTYAQTANVVQREIQTLIPRATQTGALAMGGVPEITVQSVVAKIVANQPLTAPERQLYANQSQEVEAALQAQVTPTPPVRPEVPVTPAAAPPTPAITHRGTEPAGIAIANQLGVQYDGIQAEIGMQFTDPQTGSTTYGNTLEEVRTNLENMRAGFAAPEVAPVVPAVPEVAFRAELEQRAEELARLKAELPTITDEARRMEVRAKIAELGKAHAEMLERAAFELREFLLTYTSEKQWGLMSFEGKPALEDRATALGQVGLPTNLASKNWSELTTEQQKRLSGEILIGEVKPPAVEVAKPPVEPIVSKPQQATQAVKAIQEQGRTAPESVPPESAETSHIEMAAPDGPQPPKPPKPPTAQKDADDIFKEITEKGYNERVDQTLLRLHEAAIGNETRRTALSIKAGGEKLKEQGIGVWRRAHLIPRPKDIEKLDELYIALHNPSGVEAGTVKVPEGLESVYEELRALADWETSALLDFDPNAATIDDWFFRGWKPPTDMFTGEGARLGVKPRALRTPRVDATYREMRDLGFEPLFWNPYEQWGYRHNLGVKYREQMELIKHLKGIGEDLIRPHDGGPIPTGWRVPEVGPAFEGKPFAIQDPDTGLPSVMFTRRWITEGKIANSLENIYGKKPNLGRFVVKGIEIDPMKIIDALVFIPKRAKLFLSYFQQVDFLTRAGGGGWAKAVDDLAAGRPIDAVKSVVKYPKVAFEVIQANFSPTKRLKLSQQMDNTEPLVQGRPGINLKGISEAGLSTRDVTIFPEDMDKLVRDVANETGVLKKIPEAIAAMESAMRRGLFDGVYPAAIITDIQNNIAQMVTRQHPSLNDAQINSIIARIANIKYSTIPPSQSVIQNRMLRETLRRVFFSVGESEGLLRQATNAFHGPNKRFWAKHWLGVYFFLITTAMIIHYASTGKMLPADRFSPISKDNWGPLPFGYNREFAAPTIPIKGRGDVELTLDLAGQMDTAFRVLDPINFLTSRESVPVRSITNQISGTDFYGAPIDDVGPGGIISRTSQLLHDLFAPIGLGGIAGEAAREFIPGATEIVPRAEDRLGLAGQAIQATGMNIRAETTMDLLDRYARESGFNKADGTPVESWDELEPYQKNELSRNEELETELGLRSEAAIERQQLKAQGFATLDELNKERVVRGEGLVSTLFRDLEVEGADRSNVAYNFRSNATDLKREISIRKAQVDEDFQLFKDTGKIEKDPNKRALTEYYNTFDLAKNKTTKVIDWDKQDRLELALRRKWTGSQEAYVDRNIGLTEWGPLFNEYEIQRRTLSNSGYWETDPKDRKKFRRLNPEIETILTGKFYGYVPLAEQVRRPTRAGIVPVPTIGFGTTRPRRAAPTYPTFPKPRISTGTRVRAPSVPGIR